MCEARLICDNDAKFMNSSMLDSDVLDALTRAKVYGILRYGRLRIVAGFWVERYGTLPVHCEGVSPWYDSHYDPADPRQVVPAKISALDLDAVLSGYPSHAEKVKAMTECYGSVGDISAVEMRVLKGRSVGTDAAFMHIYGTNTGRMSSSQPNLQELPKAGTMSNPTPIKIETRVFIDGVQASGFTIDQLHQKVREQESVIKDLEKIENKSKKLAAEITKRYESIKALNEYIDGLPD